MRQAQPMRWKLIPGLCGLQGTISFQSVDNSNLYLRHRGFLLYEDPYTNTDLYKSDTCFYQQHELWFTGHDAFESVNFPGRYIRHQNYRLKLHSYEAVALFEKDASFRSLVPTCSQFQSYNFPAFSFGLSGTAAYIQASSGYKWILVSPGLTGQPGTVSFRGCLDATKYLRHSGFVLWEHPYDSSLLYKKDATYFMHKNKWFNGYDAYESINFPLYFIRHQYYRLKISDYDGSHLFKLDGSFKKRF